MAIFSRDFVSFQGFSREGKKKKKKKKKTKKKKHAVRFLAH